MNNTMSDITELLGLSEKRAEEIEEECYTMIAALQEQAKPNQVQKAIKSLSTAGKTQKEQFFAGFMLGRIVQINATALDGADAYVDYTAGCVAKVKEHPEFG